jgi:sodium-coupled neutral amino acid transporter 11
LAKASTLALISMGVIVVTVVVQGALTPRELRGSFGKNELVINDGIFQAIGVISFGVWFSHPDSPLRCHANEPVQRSSATTTPS